MKERMFAGRLLISVSIILFSSQMNFAQTTALWLFDEQIGIYPSCVLNESSDNDYPLVLGPGGQIVEGKFGNALEAIEQPPVVYPHGEPWFGLRELPIPKGRTVPPMTWMNANFCALMTSGENHLRKEVGFAQVTKTKLNLGAFDWTVEFWYLPTRITGEEGVVFEIGRGPRGENDQVTRLVTGAELRNFMLFNQPGNASLVIPTDSQALNSESRLWHHFAFVYSADTKTLHHFVDGKLQSQLTDCEIKALPYGDEDYMSIGRDGLWNRPLPGRIDELRFSAAALYNTNFEPPQSFSPFYNGKYTPEKLIKGPPLLFASDSSSELPVQLGSRKHLFIDDALVQKMENIRFVVNPPRLAERVIDGIVGAYRKHLTVVEDEDGLLRMYNSVQDDYLQVMTSRDGIHWEMPDLGRGEYRGHKNIVIPEPVGGLGNPFIDPNGSDETRWKYISGYHRRAIFLYTSADGYTWTRHKTSILPFRSGTQSCTFYDDQRQLYVSYHRTGFAKTPGGATQRESVLTETKDLFKPWSFRRVSQEETWEAAKKKALRDPQPWYLDNGPLTPGGFGIEYPHKFAPVDSLDPVGTDIYVTKATKYPWAPDTYLAFPIVYFHYELDGPETRQILMEQKRDRGSGPVETQLAVSRDGVNWQRYPRPAYVGIGRHEGRDIHQAFLAHGMVRRGEEIWQYYYGNVEYHSSWTDKRSQQAVYRLVQRLDGFVSADSPYDKVATLVTRPLVFKGNRLVLNIDTEATGFAQVGFLDESGNPFDGFSVDDCIYINGDFIDTEVEWMERGKDLTSLQGKTVQLVFRMRGSKLYSLQFIEKSPNDNSP